jgi:hypothetical protein
MVYGALRKIKVFLLNPLKIRLKDTFLDKKIEGHYETAFGLDRNFK